MTNRIHRLTEALPLAAFVCVSILFAACGVSDRAAAPPPVAGLPVEVAKASDVPAADKIDRPTLRAGDVWIDRVQGADHEFRINSINGDTMLVDFWGTEETTDRDLNVIVYRSLTQASSEPSVSSKPGMWFSFPLYPGKTWVNDFDWEMKGAAPVRGKGEDRGKVIGWEDILVPAGSFHALKVEVTSRFFGKGGMADEDTLTYWYSPKVNRFVKFDYRGVFEGAMMAELVSYKPAK